MAREIDHREQQVADLCRGLGALAARDLGLDLGCLLADLRQHRHWVIPVEADLAGLGLQLERAGERGQGVPAVRSAAMICKSRAMSRDGVMAGP
jgi:hypothetical protein